MTDHARLPQGYRLHAFDRVGSTNDVARRLAEAGGPEGAVVSARVQTAGRGRHGRTWVSPPGNLYATVLLRPERAVAETSALSLVAGLALADALALLGAAPGRLKLKWPNDVLIDGAKVAGLLLESGADGTATDWVVVGSGVNLVSAPQGTSYPATSLAAAGLSGLSPERVLGVYLERLDARYRAWRADGFGRLRGDWLGHALGIGEPIRLRLAEGEISGRFVDLTPGGALLLEDRDGGRRTVTAGDVVYGH